MTPKATGKTTTAASGRAQCTVDGCGRPVKGRGLCGMHYARWRKHGDPEAAAVKTGPAPARGKPRNAMSLRFNENDYTWLEEYAARTGAPIRAVITSAVHMFRDHVEAGGPAPSEMSWTFEQKMTARRADRLWQQMMDAAREAVAAEGDLPGRDTE